VHVLVVVVCAWFFHDPPRNWWPADHDPPALTGMLPLVWLLVVMTAGVSIFGISFQVPFAKEQMARTHPCEPRNRKLL
jgi:hypothetical protein